jgi:hypothetical protein
MRILGQSDFETAAGSEMIMMLISGFAASFLVGAVFDCRVGGRPGPHFRVMAARVELPREWVSIAQPCSRK